MANTAYKNWEDARAQAIKMLGKKGSLPKEPALIGKAMLDFNEYSKEIHKARDALEQKCKAAQAVAGKAGGAASAYAKVLERADFGLSADDKEDKKLIAQVRKLLLDKLEDIDTVSDQLFNGFNTFIDKLGDLNADLTKVIIPATGGV